MIHTIFHGIYFSWALFPSGQGLSSDNVIDRKSDVNVPMKIINEFIPITATATGRLSRCIETNLNVSSDFYVCSEKLSETVDNFCDRKDTTEMINKQKPQKKPNGKTILDKYFRMTKPSYRRLRDLNADKFISVVNKHTN